MTQNIIILGSIQVTPLIRAADTFKQGLATAKSQLERDSVIQRFEFTYELVWKTLKRILAFKGLDITNPRDVFREAAKQKLITDPTIWFEFINKRNLTVHTYNPDVAEDIYESLPLFGKELDKFLQVLKTLETPQRDKK